MITVAPVSCTMNSTPISDEEQNCELVERILQTEEQDKPFLSKSEAPTSFPFEIVQVSGSEAIGALEDQRLQGKREGFTAVLLGGPENVGLLSEAIEDKSITPEEVLEQAGIVEVQTWFSDRVKQEPDCYEAELGEWPSKPDTQQFIDSRPTWFC